MTQEEIIKRALYAYGMEFTLRREATRYDGEYSLRCDLAADWWLEEARKYRAFAEACTKLSGGVQ